MHHDKNFYSNISKIFICSKIENSKKILYRYNKDNKEKFISDSIEKLNIYIEKIMSSSDRKEILGYEGAVQDYIFNVLIIYCLMNFIFQAGIKDLLKILLILF